MGRTVVSATGGVFFATSAKTAGEVRALLRILRLPQLGVNFKDAFRVRKSIFKERKLTMQQVDKPRRAPRILAALFSAVLAAGALVSAAPTLAAETVGGGVGSREDRQDRDQP